MSKIKRIMAALAAGAVMLTATGCSDTTYVMTYNNGTKINAGIYLYNMFNEMSYQYYYSGYAEDFLEQEVDGQKMPEYLKEQATKATKEYAGIVYQFEQLGLTLDESELSQAQDEVNSMWESNSGLFEIEGISKESLNLISKAELMRTALYNYYYGEEGTERPADADIAAYVTDNYVRYKTVRISKSYDSDETVKAAEDEESMKLRDSYLEEAKSLDFDSFNTVIEEYNDYLDAKAAEEEAAAAASDESETQLGEPVAEETETEESEPETPSEAETVETPENSDELTTDDEDMVLLTAEEEAADPYANENMRNLGSMTDEDLETTTGKLLTAINALEVGKAGAYEDDDAYYVIIKGDVSARAEAYAQENTDTVISEMMNDDFQAKIDSWVDAAGVVENSNAVRRYTAKEVFDRQNDYYQSTAN